MLRLRQAQRNVVFRRVDRAQILVDAGLGKRLEACHRVVTQHIAVIASRITHVAMRRLVVHKRHFLGGGRRGFILAALTLMVKNPLGLGKFAATS